MMQSRGRGAMKPLVKRPVEDRFCISPQLAPPPAREPSKSAMMKSEDYHEGGRK